MQDIRSPHGVRPVIARQTQRDVFTPTAFALLREGYNTSALRADVVAGLTVAIVALPLSMAIAIASGVEPARGLITAIIGGFLVSLFGGSRYQIGGPAGAFIVLVAATVDRHGVDGLVLATLMSGIMLALLGTFRVGAYIKLVPYPVTVGFTAGIAVIIFASQIHEFLGLRLPGREPGDLVPKLDTLARAIDTTNWAAVLVALLTIGIIAGLRRERPQWPALLIAVVVASLVSVAGGLPIETIGTRFGGLPQTLPWPHLPEVTSGKLIAVLPDAIGFALLGAIESLLSAVVADGMSGRRHRSNTELVGQGVANVGSALFGGMCVTGTIARTATNVRAGAHGPVAGMMHAVFLLLFMLLAAPLAAFIPLSALAGVLVVIAWNMIERDAIRALVRSPGDATVLAATFGLTIFRDLTSGIVVGVALGALLFIERMSRSILVENSVSVTQGGSASVAGSRAADVQALSDDVVVYRISGAFFFGTASLVEAAFDGLAHRPTTMIIDFSSGPYIDSTAAHVLDGIARKEQDAGRRVIVAGATRQVRRTLITHGLRQRGVRFAPNVVAARALVGAPATPPPKADVRDPE